MYESENTIIHFIIQLYIPHADYARAFECVRDRVRVVDYDHVEKVFSPLYQPPRWLRPRLWVRVRPRPRPRPLPRREVFFAIIKY
jgi:hypothetical protein